MSCFLSPAISHRVIKTSNMYCNDRMRVNSLLTGEFGVVYRARLGSKGISCQEVAVKTLKGFYYDYSLCSVV